MTAKACLPSDTISIEQIGDLAPDDYVGLIDEAAVEFLKARLRIEGLLTPIWVRRNGPAAHMPYSVVEGRHRLLAAKALGWTSILAEVRADKSSTSEELKALQLAANLDRRVMRPIEYARFIMVRWAIAAESLPDSLPKSQQEQAIRKRWDVLRSVSNTPVKMRQAVDASAAVQSGVSEATVRRYRSIYEKLFVPFPDKAQEINAHPLGASLEAVQELGRVAHNVPKEHKTDWANPKSAREKAIAMFLSKPDWKNITEVLVAAGIHESNGFRVDERNHGAVITTAWSKMALPDKRTFIVRDLPKLLTKDMAGKLVDTLVAEFEL